MAHKFLDEIVKMSAFALCVLERGRRGRLSVTAELLLTSLLVWYERLKPGGMHVYVLHSLLSGACCRHPWPVLICSASDPSANATEASPFRVSPLSRCSQLMHV